MNLSVRSSPVCNAVFFCVAPGEDVEPGPEETTDLQKHPW